MQQGDEESAVREQCAEVEKRLKEGEDGEGVGGGREREREGESCTCTQYPAYSCTSRERRVNKANLEWEIRDHPYVPRSSAWSSTVHDNYMYMYNVMYVYSVQLCVPLVLVFSVLLHVYCYKIYVPFKVHVHIACTCTTVTRVSTCPFGVCISHCTSTSPWSYDLLVMNSPGPLGR